MKNEDLPILLFINGLETEKKRGVWTLLKSAVEKGNVGEALFLLAWTTSIEAKCTTQNVDQKALESSSETEDRIANQF